VVAVRAFRRRDFGSAPISHIDQLEYDDDATYDFTLSSASFVLGPDYFPPSKMAKDGNIDCPDSHGVWSPAHLHAEELKSGITGAKSRLKNLAVAPTTPLESTR
jgi:hypothetical protein